MNYDCFDTEELISKGHKARRTFLGRRKSKYDWETLTLENKLFIETDHREQTVLSSARTWAKNRSLKWKFRGKLDKKEGKFGILVWRIK